MHNLANSADVLKAATNLHALYSPQSY